MVTVRLTREQCENDRLPSICARCGEPTTGRVARTFTWHPPWVGVFLLLLVVPGLLLMLALRKSMRVRVPLCDRHGRHWSSPAVFAGVSLPLCALVVIGGLYADLDSDIMRLGAFAFLGCLMVSGVWQSRLIRPERITSAEMLLANVCMPFAEAAKALRDGEGRVYGDFDDEPTRPRRNRYDVDVAEE